MTDAIELVPSDVKSSQLLQKNYTEFVVRKRKYRIVDLVSDLGANQAPDTVGKQNKMQWTRSETLALAQQSCSICYGLGLRPGRSGVSTPCNCVFRAIFRACYARFRTCAMKEKHISRVSLEANPGRQRKSVWGMKNEEFMADFCLISRRELNDYEYTLFKFHFLLAADWKLCCRKLKMDRGTFFHDVYRIQQKLGRVFRELEPHALFPLDEYFNSTPRTNQAVATPFAVETEAVGEAKNILRFPVKKAA